MPSVCSFSILVDVHTLPREDIERGKRSFRCDDSKSIKLDIVTCNSLIDEYFLQEKKRAEKG